MLNCGTFLSKDLPIGVRYSPVVAQGAPDVRGTRTAGRLHFCHCGTSLSSDFIEIVDYTILSYHQSISPMLPMLTMLKLSPYDVKLVNKIMKKLSYDIMFSDVTKVIHVVGQEG